MARNKKKSNTNHSNAEDAPDSGEEVNTTQGAGPGETPQQENDVPDPEPSQDPSILEAAGSGDDTAKSRPVVAEDDVDQLKAELAALKASNAELASQLRQKDEEISALHRQLDQSTQARGFDKHEDLQAMQQTLVQLKKDQAKAEAVRNEAWKNLKSVVLDIHKLASPEHLVNLTASAVGPFATNSPPSQ